MKIKEMTMSGPDLNLLAQQFADKNKQQWATSGEYIADIEDYKVLKNLGSTQNSDHYSLWDKNNLVGFASLGDDNVVDGVWVNPDYRGRKIFSMMLWFFKTRLNKSPLILGDIHSKDMQELVKGLSRFEKKWYNIKTKEVEPFSLETLDNYYSHGRPTQWRLILENDGEFSWPMFNRGNFIKEAYEVFVD